VPGDFNGDSVIDVLVVSKIVDSSNKYQMSLFLGNKSSKYENMISGSYKIKKALFLVVTKVILIIFEINKRTKR
jgi:hypothetical protein